MMWLLWVYLVGFVIIAVVMSAVLYKDNPECDTVARGLFALYCALMWPGMAVLWLPGQCVGLVGRWLAERVQFRWPR